MRTVPFRLSTMIAATLILTACAGTRTVNTAPKPVEQVVRNTAVYDMSRRAPADRDGYQPPNKLAVLLPLSGNAAAAAKPVRDGFLTAYYSEQRARPPIKFYDTAQGVSAAYAKAVADGSDYVVGPLLRDEVSALFAKPDAELRVPVLALNRAQAATPGGSVSYALTPEDEALAIANAMYGANLKHVLVFTTSDATQRRAAGAFVAQYTLQNAVAGTPVLVNAKSETLAADIAAAVAAETQAHGKIDGVFFSARGEVVRAVIPLLAGTAIATVPRMATSQIQLGNAGATDMQALDGIRFPLEYDAEGQGAGKAASRLREFGSDAWLITAYLGRIASGEHRLNGATGKLGLNNSGLIVRDPEWAVYRNGVPATAAR